MSNLRYLIPPLLGLLALFSCEPDREEPQLPDELFDISEVRFFLQGLADEDNLITTIDTLLEAGFDYYRCEKVGVYWGM